MSSTQCDCSPNNKETDEEEVCVCYPSSRIVECRNYKYCNEKLHLPKWASFGPNGMCTTCAIQMGKHTYTNKVENCCVCLENKRMIMLKCNHTVCNDCWYNITKDGVDQNKYSLCPLCRRLNDCFN